MMPKEESAMNNRENIRDNNPIKDKKLVFFVEDLYLLMLMMLR